FYTPYYADLYTLWFDGNHRQLLTEDSGPHRKEFGEADLEALLETRPPPADVIVTAEKDSSVPKIPFLQRLNDAQLRAFGVQTERGPLRLLLERTCGDPVEHAGFLFWTPK
ncbi:MAG TPA: hypothetical protein VMU54_17295, partial [Planctomycetota bacterium]|nr:hypothetical protein [Planctomycetota bacterium]